MVNNNIKVLIFVIMSFLLLVLISIFSGYLQQFWPEVENINIISDILYSKYDNGTTNLFVEKNITGVVTDTTSMMSRDSLRQDFTQYMNSGQFVDFKPFSLGPVLPRTAQKLAALKRGEKVKLRIAWLGDSLIEGDLITQTTRELLQKEFSGLYGVGFVPFRSVTSGFRISATAISSGSWSEENFKNAKRKTPLFFSGHVFYSNNGELSLKDNTIKDSLQLTEKWLYCGKTESPLNIDVNGKHVCIHANAPFNRILLEKSKSRNIRIKIPTCNLPLYGVSSEPEYGVVIDNYSFRGISGFELGMLDESVLDEISRTGVYDLIVIQYGVNMMFRPTDKNYDYYSKGMNPVIKRLKERIGASDFLLVSCSDRAFRYGNEWKTAIGLESLLKVQAKIACNNSIPFFNLFETMGGSGTIVKWAEGDPRLAAKDYIHASPRGAIVLGRDFFDAFMKDFKKLSTNKVK
jgi:lysophospholipase L1-like esterase